MDDKGTFAERNDAKRLENDAIRLKRGFVRGTLLPTTTYVVAFVLCVLSVKHFCIKGTVFDTTEQPEDRDVYYDAQRAYNDGNLKQAASQAAKILVKVPDHGPANQLMARVALARGDRKSAIGYLRHSLNGSLNREEVTKWISALEALEAGK